MLIPVVLRSSTHLRSCNRSRLPWLACNGFDSLVPVRRDKPGAQCRFGRRHAGRSPLSPADVHPTGAQNARAPLTSRSKIASCSASTSAGRGIRVEPGDLLVRRVVVLDGGAEGRAPGRTPCCSRTPSSAPCRRPGPAPAPGATAAMVSQATCTSSGSTPAASPEPGVDLVPGRRVVAGDGEALADRRRVPQQPDEGHGEVVGVGQRPLAWCRRRARPRACRPASGRRRSSRPMVGHAASGRTCATAARSWPGSPRRGRRRPAGPRRRSCPASTARTGCAAGSTRSPAPGPAASGTPRPS